MGELTVDCGYPHRGISAGCSFATLWVQLYTLPPLQVWQGRCPQVSQNIFIDDLLGSVTAPEEHLVVGRLTHGAAELHRMIEEELECKVAMHKSILLASSDKLLKKLQDAFGKFGGQAKKAAPNLGVDHFVGRVRARRTSTSTLRGRQRKLLRRCRRLRSLKRAGYNMRELFTTGLQSASLYGAEVTGVDAAQLKEARSSYLNLVGSPSTSSSTALTLALTGDPLWRQGLGPALTWSGIVWKSATSSAFQKFMPLPQLGRLAGPAVQRLPRNWGKSEVRSERPISR
jgi:hypothetical protein